MPDTTIAIPLAGRTVTRAQVAELLRAAGLAPTPYSELGAALAVPREYQLAADATVGLAPLPEPSPSVACISMPPQQAPALRPSRSGGAIRQTVGSGTDAGRAPHALPAEAPEPIHAPRECEEATR